jgi:hypothetical protein
LRFAAFFRVAFFRDTFFGAAFLRAAALTRRAALRARDFAGEPLRDVVLDGRAIA